MKKLKRSVKITAAVLAGLSALAVLSTYDRGVSAMPITGSEAVSGGRTGIEEHVFAEEEQALDIVLCADHVEVDYEASFVPEACIAEIQTADGVLPVLKICSDVNTEENGEYAVSYEVTDLSGHTAEASLAVTVRYSEAQLKEIAEREAAEKAAAEEAARREAARAQANAGNVSLSTLGVIDTGTVYAMVEAINAVRASYGLYPYAYAGQDGFNAAAIRAQECTYYLSHTRPNGTAYSTALDECGVSHGQTAEILVAYGSSVETNLNWWLSEPGHRAIVLGNWGTYLAVGYAGGIWSGEVY